MTTPARFDRRHGKEAFLRLCAMLADPAFAYQQIGDEFGLTRQRIFAIAKELGVDDRSAVMIERSEFVVRTSHRGKKLYGVGDKQGRFKDIQSYKRAHAQDRKRRSRKEK